MTANPTPQAEAPSRPARWLDRLAASLARRHAEAELRAMDERELRDLALDRGGIDHAVRHGRER